MEYAAAMRDLAAERNARRSVEVAQPSDPALLQLDVDKARAELGVIEDRERHLTVTAPIGGIVTRILAAPGEMIFLRDPLFEVSDAATLDVRGTIAPELVRHVRAGMAAEVKIFTVPPRRFTTTIRTVTPAVDAGGAAVVVSVSNPDGALQPGTPATITVR
jgi:multidrug resistance efflux pump